jgi:hypothetical protein
LPTLPVPNSEILLALMLVAVGSTLQGSVGFGLAVVAAPILLLLDPIWVPGPLLFAASLLAILITLRDHRHIILGDIALGTFGRLIGTIPAAWALSVFSRATYDLAFGIVVLAAVALSASGWHIARTRINLVIAGVLSGIAGTVSSIGGPPMALVYQHEKGPTVRSTMSAIFIIGTFISLAGLWWIGRFGAIEFTLGLILMPAVLLGFWFSRYTAPRIDAAHTRPAILTVSALSAAIVLIRAIWNLV